MGHHLHKDRHHTGTRITNLVFVLLSLIFAIGFQILIGGDIVSFFLLNAWVITNLVFIFLPDHSLINFLKCRVCVVYVLFGFIVVWQVIVLLGLTAVSAATAAASSANDSIVG